MAPSRCTPRDAGGNWMIRGAALVAGLIGLALGGALAGAQPADPAYTVTVAAGGVDRHATVVSLVVPRALPAGAYHLEDDAGRRTPLQVDGRRAWFVLDRLAAGAERTYQLRAGAAPAKGVEVVRQGRTVSLVLGDQPVAQYWARPRPLPDATTDSLYLRGGYLHPVRTPSGRVVTGDYPADHRHHHGVWAAWANTSFEGRSPDFWNMGKGTGAVVPLALDTTWAGPVQAGMQARHRYVDRSAGAPVTALYERWTLRAYRVGAAAPSPYRLVDLALTQSTASASPLIMPAYHYGGVAIRGPDAWYGASHARFLTSAGHDRATGNETRARWTYMGGMVDGQQAGIAMLSHPTNARSPQPVRIHPEMPYFCYAPPQRGPLAIRPGGAYAARYRLVTFDGPPDPALLDRLWTDYAYPPAVTVESLSPRSQQ